MPHPSWVRGLKCVNGMVQPVICGAAPFMGAWIEICAAKRTSRGLVPHPSWVRGLKWQNGKGHENLAKAPHPSWVRGLKYQSNSLNTKSM